MLQHVEGTEITDLTARTDDGIVYGMYCGGGYWDTPPNWRWFVERRVESNYSETLSIRLSGMEEDQEKASEKMMDAITRVRAAKDAIADPATTDADAME